MKGDELFAIGSLIMVFLMMIMITISYFFSDLKAIMIFGFLLLFFWISAHSWWWRTDKS